MLAAIGPQMQKYLWWKKYLTTMQMVQFVVVFLHAMQLFFHNPCGYPIFFCYVVIGHAIMFFFLFKGLNVFASKLKLVIHFYSQAFYVKSYVIKEKINTTSHLKEMSIPKFEMCFPKIENSKTL
jgi:GNS1/SUR4 family